MNKTTSNLKNAINKFNTIDHENMEVDTTNFFVEEVCGNIVNCMENEINWTYKIENNKLTHVIIAYVKDGRVWLFENE